ncbi:Hypothetical protein DHA2_19259 [Giardia duodenalis]|uniref:Transmembrane protein n=1 Tax=Giardia intestinalis TaxID=5741 RepID=V6THG2_GIAIN|nr:Hypothetical protein DHA2_19259 [Giardia intestinalis]
MSLNKKKTDRMADIPTVSPGAVAVHEYLRAQTLFILMYAYITRPNIYAFFSVILTLIFYESSNIGLYVFLVLAAASAPISCYYLSRSYLLLNLLTYFPYDSNRQEWQEIASFVLPWVGLVVAYSIQFFHQRKYGYMTPIGRFLRNIRAMQMGRV